MDGKQPERGSLRVPAPGYCSRWRVLFLLLAEVAVFLYDLLAISRHWDDIFVGSLDLRVLLCGVWRCSKLLFHLSHKFAKDIVDRYGLRRVLTYLVFILLTSLSMSALSFGSLPAYAWETVLQNGFIAKVERNIVKVNMQRDFSSNLEHHPETEGRSPPFMLETFHRYQGEDVQFNCQFVVDVERNDILHSSMLFWLHQNETLQVVNPSPRHFVSTTLTKTNITAKESDNGTKVRLTFRSELRIYLIDDKDFGKYKCALYKEFLHLSKRTAFPKQTCRAESRHHVNQDTPESKPSSCRSCEWNFRQLMNVMACVAKRMECFEGYIMEIMSHTKVKRMLLDRNEFTRSLQEFESVYFDFISFLRHTKQCGGRRNEYFVKFMNEKIVRAEELRASTLHFFKSIHPSLWKLGDVLPSLVDIGSYRLIEMKRRTEEMRAPSGSLFSIAADFYHLNEADEVIMSYNVNGQSVEFCDETAGSCSKIVFLYWLFFHDGGTYWNVLKPYFLLFPAGCQGLVHSKLADTSRVSMEFWKCLCFASFGMHEIVFLRLFHNATSGSTTVYEYTHPHSIYVAPAPNELFDSTYQNSSSAENDSFIEKCWPTQDATGPHSCNEQEKWIKRDMGSFWRWEMLVLVTGAVLWILWLIFGLVLLPKRLGQHGRRLCLEGEMFFQHRGLPPSRPLGDLLWNPHLPADYDVFISHAAEQNDLAQDRLAPLLEGLGLRTYLRNRDLDLGTMEHMENARAVNKSRKFLVVASPDYTAHHYLNDFEFQFIIAAVNDNFISQQDVLLYLCGPCHVPPVLHSYPCIDSSDATIADLDLEARLKAWVLETPVTLAQRGWRSWRPSFPFLSCGSVCLVALWLAMSNFKLVLAGMILGSSQL